SSRRSARTQSRISGVHRLASPPMCSTSLKPLSSGRSRWALSQAWIIWVAWVMKASPSAVSLAPERLRMNSVLLSWLSRLWIREVMAAWVTCKRSAAATKLPQRTISRKVRARLISMCRTPNEEAAIVASRVPLRRCALSCSVEAGQQLAQRYLQPGMECADRLPMGRGDIAILQHQQLIDAPPQKLLGQLLPLGLGPRQTGPGVDDDPGVERQRLQLPGIHQQDAGIDECLVQPAGVAQAALGKGVVALGKVGVGFQQVVQVLLQEAELPDDLQQLFQQVRLVVQGQRRLRQGEERVEPLFEALEQLGHYHRLVAEVVIE